MSVTKNILILPVTWSGTSCPAPTETWATVISNLSSFYSEVSYGQFLYAFTLASAVTIAVPVDQTSVALTERTAAKAAATTAGYNLASYDGTVYVWPLTVTTADGSAGDVTIIDGGKPCTDIKSSAFAFASPIQVMAHELGHMAGILTSPPGYYGVQQFLPHSHLISETVQFDPADFHGGNPNFQEYGNQYDVMGGGIATGHFSARQKDALGWMAGRKHTISATGSYTISNLEAASPAYPQALIVQSGGYTYWLEYRTQTGFDNFLGTTVDGVYTFSNPTGPMVYVLGNGTPFSPTGFGQYDQEAFLLDMTPPAGNPETSVELSQGLTFTAPGGMTITTTAHTSTTTTVAVYVPLPSGIDPVFTAGIPDGARTNSTSETFSWAPLTGATWWTQLDNDAWVNRGSATSVTLTNLHGATRHRFRLMSVTSGVPSRIAHREWDIVGPYSRVKFTVGTETCLVIPIQYGGHIGDAAGPGVAIPSGTPTDWQAQLDTINAYHQENSWGQFSFVFTLMPMISIPYPSASVAPSDPRYFGEFYTPMMAAADGAALAAGYDRNAYQHVYYMPPSIGDGMIGADLVVTNPSLTQPLVDLVPNGLDPTYIYGLNASTHEFGHSLGFSHANALDAGTVTLSPTALTSAEANPPGAANVEYGNPTSTMGRGQPV